MSAATQVRFMRTSPAGIHAIRFHEGVKNHYYDDQGNNCTYGVGTLAHTGPCSPAELAETVSDERIQKSLVHGLLDAEAAVKRNITRQALSQPQFDALVSFTYNTGAGGARPVLRVVNQGDFKQAAKLMKSFIYVAVMGKDGKPLRDKHGRKIMQRSNGLITRRNAEARSFE